MNQKGTAHFWPIFIDFVMAKNETFWKWPIPTYYLLILTVNADDIVYCSCLRILEYKLESIRVWFAKPKPEWQEFAIEMSPSFELL